VDLARARRQAAELVEKYRLLGDLSRGTPGRSVERRDAIRAVADRFPGAMREWDETPPEELARRGAEAEAIARALDPADPARHDEGLARLAAPENAPLRFGADLHERLRAVLRVKRWLAGRPVSRALAAEAEAALGVQPPELEAIANPDEGRVTEPVYRAVAGEHGVSVEELKRALFPGKG
jgi:hypothetical protein